MRLKAYQMPKHCTAVYNAHSQDFTILQSYHGANYLIFRCEVKIHCSNYSYPPGMCACVYLAGHSSTMPNDVALQRKLSQVKIFCIFWQVATPDRPHLNE